MISRLDKFLGGVSRAYLLASQLLLGGLVVLVGIQVILRYATGKSILGLGEWTGLMFTWLVFLMAAVLHRRKRHITITVVSDLFSEKGRLLADLFIGVAIIVFCIAVFTQLVNIWPYLSHATMVYGIPEIIFKIGLAVGIGTILLQEVVSVLSAASVLMYGKK